MSVPLWVVWIVLALASYRAQRIVTADKVWPMTAFRRRLVARGYPVGSTVYDFLRCAFCFGFWATIASTAAVHLFVVDLLTGRVRNRAAFIAMLAFAASAVVGQLGMRDP